MYSKKHLKPKHIPLECHPNDSRIKLDITGTMQTLTGRMGTGGGNVPLVLEMLRCTKREESR